LHSPSSTRSKQLIKDWRRARPKVWRSRRRSSDSALQLKTRVKARERFSKNAQRSFRVVNESQSGEKMSTQTVPAPFTLTSEFRFTSSDGLEVACYRWNSRGPTRGVIQIAHGMGEHIGRYAETIQFLVSAGLTVYANDHRGHGRTAPDKSQLGNFGEGGFDLL